MEHLIRTTLILKQLQNQETNDFVYCNAEESPLFVEGSLESEMWKHIRTLTCEIKKVEEME